jgi:hypothetical protein
MGSGRNELFTGRNITAESEMMVEMKITSSDVVDTNKYVTPTHLRANFS